jgi:cytosine/adenosine deaminase-related metal-dependent hydrolase
MAFRKFKASQIFDGYTLHQNKVLVTDQKGVVEGLVTEDGAGPDVEWVEGILMPGMINAHCHLELSHLKNVIPPHTGLIDFLCSVVTKRNFSDELIQQAIRDAEEEMYKNGIVAVGDIGNTADTAAVKSKSNINWQNFVEVLSFTDQQSDKQIQHYREVANNMEAISNANAASIRTSLVPHAPYSISPRTFQWLNEVTAGQIISMHNQEHPAEDELYKTGGGDYLKLFRIFGMESSPFPVTGLSSIRSVLPYFKNGQTILLVHNTYMPEEDLVWAEAYAKENNLNIVYCLCPNANRYIENRLPDVNQFLKHNVSVVLGTDSYSSNWQLSIAKEMQVLLNETGLSAEQVLSMATSIGAKALGLNDMLGSFEKGKQPGIVQLASDFSSSLRLL